MSEVMVQILSGIGIFFLGILVGAVFHRSVQGEASKNRRLEQKLAELQEKHEKYQAEVSEHFMKTASAVHTLNQSYRDVHEQLARGALRLCNEEQAEDFLSIGVIKKEAPATKAKESEAYIPMDYAPKTENDSGTLSEGFGIAKETSSLSEEEPTPSKP